MKLTQLLWKISINTSIRKRKRKASKVAKAGALSPEQMMALI